MAKHSRPRIKCPRCGAKSIRLLNKKQGIWECKRESCGHKFIFFAGTRRYMALADEDIIVVKPAAASQNEIIDKPAIIEGDPLITKRDPLLEMAEQLGF